MENTQVSQPRPDVPFNVKEIQEEVAESLQCGSVTPDYPLDVDRACEYLNLVLATEILCVLRYRHHQVIAKGMNNIQVAEEFAEHAEDEEKHVHWVAERINQLGGDPDYNPQMIIQRSATEYGSATDLRDMIMEDLVAERVVIEVYRKLIQWFDSDTTTRRILEKVLEEEEEHANDLADLVS